MPDLLGQIKQSLTPLADKLAAQFKISSPSGTPLSVPVPKVMTPSATPLADELRRKFADAPVAPDPNRVAAGKIFGDVKNIATGALGTFGRFLGNQAGNVEDFVTGKLKITPDDVLYGMKNTGIGALKITGTLAQGFLQGVNRIGTSVADVSLPGFKEQRLAYQSDPNSLEARANKFLTGEQVTSTYQELFHTAHQYAEEKGATPGGAATFGGFAVLGSLFMDNPATGEFGGAGKLGLKLGKGTVEELAKTTADDEIKAILKASNPHVSEDAIDFITPIFRNAQTPEDVVAAQKMVNGAAKTAVDITEKKAVVERARTEIPEDLHPVIDQARKFDNPADFAKSLEPGTAQAIRDARPDLPAIKESPELGPIALLPERIKALEEEVAGLRRRLVKTPIGQADARNLIHDELKAKTDFINRGTALFKEQAGAQDRAVRDFHAKATGADRKQETVINYRTAPVDTNLVKSLGSAKDPYEVLNILKGQYPNVPDRVLDRAVTRFVRTKRVENIENLIRSMRNLDDQFKSGRVRIAAPKPGEKFSAQPTRAAADNKAGEKILSQSDKKTLSKTGVKDVRQLMKTSEKVRYIQAIKDKFEDPKHAVAAQHEFDRVWDDVNQRVVDEYEQLSMHKGFLEDSVNAEDHTVGDIFRKLYTGPNKKNNVEGNLRDWRDLQQAAEKKQRALTQSRKQKGQFQSTEMRERAASKLTKSEQYFLHLDEHLDAAGFGQEELQRHANMLAEIHDIGEKLRALKPRMADAKMLQDYLNDVAIVPEHGVKTIDTLSTPAMLRDEYKDISGFSGGWRDITRNFETFFGKKYAEIKKAVLDPFDDAKGRFVDTNKELADGLEADIVKKFGFRRGSPESAAIQRYGDPDLEGGLRMKYEDLVKEFGRGKADNIVAADAYFRKQYDTLVDNLNVVRKKIYPNTPSKLIAKKKNYYRHFREMNDTWGEALREFFETPAGIDPNLVGLSEFTRAKTRFLPFAEARKTQDTDLDAIGGFINYIPMYAYAHEIDPQIQTFRYLRRKLAESAPRAGEMAQTSAGKVFKSKGAENFLTFLDDFTRDLTGNTNPVDRYLQRRIPGGRKTIRTLRFVNSRMKANTVGANFGSALGQLANIPAGIADAKLYALPGIQRALAGIFVKNEPMAKSIFLKERYAKSVEERFPFRFKDRPMRATGQQIRKQTKWILEESDKIGTKFIWNSEYAKALGKKVEDPIRYADDATRKLVAGRGIGEVALSQKGLRTQFIAPFTVEVMNSWWIMKDWVSRKDFAALAIFFLANHVLNQISENARGSKIVFDPIQSLTDGLMQLDQERKEGNLIRGGVKFLGRQAGEFLANIPYGQQIAAVLPDDQIQGATQFLTGAPIKKQELFGDSNISGRFGTPLIVSGLKDAVFRLLPPVGGVQLNKTYQGIRALIKGHAEDSKGSQSFNVPVTAANVSRALFFGANATSESRKYFDDRNDLFNRIDRQAAENFVSSAAAEDTWGKMKDLIKAGKRQEAADLLRKAAADNKDQAQKIADIAKAEEQGLTANDRLIKMLNVKNGERAKYIVQQLKKLTSPKDRADYIRDLGKKKLMTAEVVKQVSLLY